MANVAAAKAARAPPAIIGIGRSLGSSTLVLLAAAGAGAGTTALGTSTGFGGGGATGSGGGDVISDEDTPIGSVAEGMSGFGGATGSGSLGFGVSFFVGMSGILLIKSMLSPAQSFVAATRVVRFNAEHHGQV